MAKKEIVETAPVDAKVAAREKVKITNMQQRDWIAPICLIGGKITTAQRSLIPPLGSVIVDKELFEKYAETKVMAAMLDLKLLVVSKVNSVLKANKHDLVNAPITEPPPELRGEGNKRTMDIVSSPVTLELNPVKE